MGKTITMLARQKPFLDSREIPSDTSFDTELCIIGAGAAGITIAREFAREDVPVIVLESGGLEFEASIDALNSIAATGRNYTTQGSRLRYFGGSTNHWGGECLPLRSLDFEKRDWIPHSGWPFSIRELERYYARGHEVLEIGPPDYDPVPVATRLGHKLLPFDSRTIETVLSKYHRQRFGERYRRDLEHSANISVFLYATVTSINLDRNKRFVTDVTVTTLGGNTFRIKSKYFILAAGGIENARILLLSSHEISAGIGNQNDLVGRFFLEHIYYRSGFIAPKNQDYDSVKIYGDEIEFEDPYSVRCHIALPETRLRELRICNYRAELLIGPSREWYPSVQSAYRLKRHIKSLSFEHITVDDVLNVISDPLPPFAEALGWDSDELPLVYGFANNIEQVPNPESRVQLTTQRDALGQNKVVLNWQISNLDKESIVKAQEVVAREVGRSGIGRMRISIPEVEETLLYGADYGYHHMGTTRMHVDPKQGVVDADCKIHGLENIFIAGSSVFPTVGFANPTLTIVALALRLADHIRIRV